MDAAAAISNVQKVQGIFRMLSMLQMTAHIYPAPASVQDGANFDFVIVGGGTAGCVIASRLAECKNTSVLLIEAGENPPFESLYAGFVPFLKDMDYDYKYTSTKEDIMQYHKGGVADITLGKMLGGSSCLNYLDYGRGYQRDYDNWAKVTNDSSWNYKSVLPLLRRSEKVIDEKILNSPKDRALHGTQGKLQLIKYYHKEIENYFRAYKEMGNDVVVDINDRTPLGVTNKLLTVSNTFRQSTAYSFLSPLINSHNLKIMTNAFVTEVIFDDLKNAVGVKVRTTDNTIIKVNANKEVILTAGTFKTPQLLMLSGIGPSEQLRRKKIKVVVDLPVGENLQDQPICVSVYKVDASKPLAGPPNPHKFEIPGLSASFAFKKTQTYPDYHIINLILNNRENFLAYCAYNLGFLNEICDTLVKDIGDKQIFTAFNFLSYPKSRGQVLLNTTNIADQPIIKLNQYSDDEDIKKHAKAAMQFNEIINTTYFKSVDAKLMDPKLKTCEGLDRQSEKYWRCYCSGMVVSSHYHTGTCAMGAVVDSKLLVKGVQRLRVADASIMPTNVGSHIIGAVILIAQKAADMIINQYS